MYYPIFDNQECIGFVGAGVYASRLMDALLNLNIEGLPHCEYVFLNVEDGTYLYHQDESLLNTETTDKGYLEILQRIKADGNTQAGTYSYQDENGIDQLVVYKYLKDRDWVFMVRDDAEEVYGESGCSARFSRYFMCGCSINCHISYTVNPISGRQGAYGYGKCNPTPWQLGTLRRPGTGNFLWQKR